MICKRFSTSGSLLGDLDGFPPPFYIIHDLLDLLYNNIFWLIQTKNVYCVVLTELTFQGRLQLHRGPRAQFTTSKAARMCSKVYGGCKIQLS